MKALFLLIAILFISISAYTQNTGDSIALRMSLDKATAAIRTAFENGDAVLVGQLHSPNLIKYFGGNNVIIGRASVEKGAKDWFQNSKVEFIENTVENTDFVGNVAIQTVIFQSDQHRKMAASHP